MTFVGAALMTAAVLHAWVLWPRNGQEGRVMRLPAMWIVMPLTIILTFGAGGALVYTFLGR